MWSTSWRRWARLWRRPCRRGSRATRSIALAGAIAISMVRYWPTTPILRRAVAAVGAVRDRGGKVVVVTAKYEPHARASLDAVGIAADAVVGWRYGPAKGDALRDHGAQLYVGDHPADVLAAQAGGTLCVAVATGGTSRPALETAGADVVLTSLVDFPPWLEGWLTSTK